MNKTTKTIVAVTLTIICGQSVVPAQTGSTNGASTKASESNVANPIIHSLAEAEKLWEKNPEAYFRTMHNNTKQLARMKIVSDEDYQVVFGSFTNMISKPIPVDNKHSSEMLSLQCMTIENFMRNIRVRNDKNTWIVFAKYLGWIRSQIPSLPVQPKEKIVVPPSIEEWKNGLAKAGYQTELGHKNRSFTMTFMNYMEYLPRQNAEEEKYFQQLADLAKLTEEERAKLGKH